MDRIGVAAFPVAVLLGALLAVATAAILYTYHERVLDARVVAEAQGLADELARTAFSALEGGQPMTKLPETVGRSEYLIRIRENDTFDVVITSGRLTGKIFSSSVNLVLRIEDIPSAGGIVYFQRAGDVIVVSTSPIPVAGEEARVPAAPEPPQFYHFAKENAKEAAAIVSAYFHVKNVGYENIDIEGFWPENGNVLVQVTRFENDLFGVLVRGYENLENVGLVDRAWIVDELTIRENLTESLQCPSVAEAYFTGWVYSPNEAIVTLRSRSWLTEENEVVEIVKYPTIRASVAAVDAREYVVWRLEWNDYVLYYRAMAWWTVENVPGFVYESDPGLKIL
jgi:hypothetical protein